MAGYSHAENLAQRLVENGAAVGSVQFRLTKSGVPPGIAREIAVTTVEKHKREERLKKPVKIVIGLIIAWLFVNIFFSIG